MLKTRITLCCVCLLLLAWLPVRGLPTDPSRSWTAGCARVKITPESPVWLAGYASRNHPSEGVRQDIWAKALYLRDAEGNRGVMVTMDLLCIPGDFSEALRKHLHDDYGLEKSQIILNVSHTHSGPVITRSLRYIYPMSKEDWRAVDSYTELLMGKLRGLVGQAIDNASSVRLSSGNGLARFAVNRRNNSEQELTGTTELKGPYDHAVPVLKVERSTDGALLAVLFGYACHNTVLSDYLVNGDYAGYAQEFVEKNHPGTLALFFQGAGADQNALPRRKQSLAEQYGRELGSAVEQVLSEDMKALEPRLRFSYREIMLPMEPLPGREELARLAEGSDYQARWARGMMAQRKVISAYPYPVQYWEIDGQRVFSLGGELVSGYAVELKKRYGQDAFVMGYCNDVMSYVPTTTVWDEGGYEADLAHRVYALPGKWTREVYNMIMEAVGHLVENINNKE